MLDTLINIYNALEPLILVAAGASIQPLVSSWNERRKRRHELADRRQQVASQKKDTERQQLSDLVKEAAAFDSEMFAAKNGSIGADPRRHLVALRSIAMMSADQELIDAVERVWKEPVVELPRFRALLSGKIQALKGSEPAPGWLRRIAKKMASEG